MTQLVGGALPQTILRAGDYRNCDQQFFGARSRALRAELYSSEMWNRADNAYYQYEFATRWWPRRSSMLGGWGDGLSGDFFQNLTPSWISPRLQRGCNGRLGFAGYTRDQYGSAVGGCTVRLYRTSTNELQAIVTSDANGLYFATSPYNDAHFIVIHNPAGDQGGATNNAMIPA